MIEAFQINHVYLGIDGGVNTGTALWSSIQKQFVELKTLTFWEAHAYFCELIAQHRAGKISLHVIIEDVTQNRPTFSKAYLDKLPPDKKIKAEQKISQNIGGNKRDCTLWMEFFEKEKIRLIPIKPSKNSRTGVSLKDFKKETGWTGARASGHAIDAAYLVYQR